MVFQFRNWKVKGRIVLVQTKLIYYSLSVFSLWQSMDLCLVWGVMLFSAQNGMVGSVTAFLKKHRSDPSVYLKILIMIEAWYVEVFVTRQVPLCVALLNLHWVSAGISCIPGPLWITYLGILYTIVVEEVVLRGSISEALAAGASIPCDPWRTELCASVLASDAGSWVLCRISASLPFLCLSFSTFGEFRTNVWIVLHWQKLHF